MLGRWRSSAGWVAVAVVCAATLVGPCSAGDPFAYFDFDVSYITASPLGVPQQVTSPACVCTSFPFTFTF